MLTPIDHYVFNKDFLILDKKTINSNSLDILIDVLSTPMEFYNLEDEWNLLLKDTPTNSFFLSWEWISLWWDFFQENKQLHIITARKLTTNELIGIAPFAISKDRSITGLNEKNLIFLGNGKAAPDHLDFIIKQEYKSRVNILFTKVIWAEEKKWNQIKVDGLRSTSQVFYQLLYQQPYLIKKVNRTICPYISLPESWEKLNQSFSKNMRYNLGRFQRRLEKDYPEANIEYMQVHETSEIKKFFITLIDLHMASQRRKGKVGLFADQIIINFHMKLAEILLEKDMLRAYTLRVGRKHIASLYCFQYNGVVSFYQSGFDQGWSRYSPGSLIMAHAIKAAIKENNHTFDFLRGDEDYKFKWTDHYTTNLSFFIPLSLQNQIELKLKKIGRKFLSQF